MNATIPAPESKRLLRIAVPILVSVSGVTIMLLLSRFLQNGTIPVWTIWDNLEVNFTFTMQMLMLPVSFTAVLFIYVYHRPAFITFFTIRIRSTTEEGVDWNLLGPLLAVVFTMGTTMYMFASVAAQDGQVNAVFYRLLPLVFLLAATNAWTEEIFTRFVIVAGLYGKLSPTAVCWISALVFGLPHFFGTPSGVFGVIMAGLMGWLLARSVIATKSMAWALFIHFLQDVVIFGAGAMVIAGNV